MSTKKTFIWGLLWLVAHCAKAQDYTAYFTGNQQDKVTTPKGGVCLMGGSTEVDEAMKWFLKQCNGGDVLVLRHSGSNGYNDYMYSELGIPVNSVESIVCQNANASNAAYIHEKIKKAEGIWFAGGDQWKYISYWRNTRIDTLINEAISVRNIVVGGTSAGMAIQGGAYFSAQNGTVTSQTALANPYAPQVKVDTLPFLRNPYLANVITDTHYDNPDRRGRQVAFMSRAITDWQKSLRGIACDERTAVCIEPSGLARVYGTTADDLAYFLQINCETGNNTPETCLPGQPLHWQRENKAIKAYIIQGNTAGNRTFNLNDWKTATGGNWQHWSVNNGQLQTTAGTVPECISAAQDAKAGPQAKLRVFPNPLTGSIIQVQVAGEIIEKIFVMDDLGRMVWNQSYTQATEQALVLDVAAWPKGIYSVRVFTRNNESGFVERLIIP
jgi:cyanophycinase-like exopeptidase